MINDFAKHRAFLGHTNTEWLVYEEELEALVQSLFNR